MVYGKSYTLTSFYWNWPPNLGLWLVQTVSATSDLYFELRIGFSGPKNPIKDILHGSLCDIRKKLDFDLFLLDLTSKSRPPAGLDGQRDLGHIFWANNWIRRPKKPMKDILHGNLYDIWEKLDFDLFLLDLASKSWPLAGTDGQRNFRFIFWAKNLIQWP